MWLSSFFEKAFVNPVNRRINIRIVRFWRSTKAWFLLGSDCAIILAGKRVLTYMSIEGWIEGLVREGRLFEVRPALPGQPVERRVYATREVNDLLLGPWPHSQAAQRCANLRADFDAFVSGMAIGVSVTPYKAKTARMGLLYPEDQGVWDFRSDSPRPGIRVLGQFAQPDTFIALIPAARSKQCDYIGRGPLGDKNSPEWKAIITDTKRLYYSLMPMFPSVRGSDASDYFQSNYYLV